MHHSIRCPEIVSPQSSQYLVLIGEVATQTDVGLWAAHFNLIGLYGPAEYAIGTTINDCLGKSTSAANIGRGYAAIRWVVDAQDHSKLVPIGVDGELLIESPALSRSYINYSDRTVESFITAPCA